MKNIAVLMTCFNRKYKTCSCLQKLYLALKYYNDENIDEPLIVKVYLVDDGCTDGTVDAVLTEFPKENIQIIKGTGSLFWAGGMRLAWHEASKEKQLWDFYLLLNDDTEMFSDVFIQLLQIHNFCVAQYGIGGIYSGATCGKDDYKKCTYGGRVWVNRFMGKSKKLSPSGIPQMCDMANANILLISLNVVDKIGALSKDYQHALADYDYTIRARKQHIPVLLTPFFCGICDNDHPNNQEIAKSICAISFAERKRYFTHPIHSNSDYLRYIRNTSPMRWFMVWAGRMLNLYFPKIYYSLKGCKYLK